MFTATKDLILPTTVCGSWPKPQWFTEQFRGRSLSERMLDVGFREQYTDALTVVIDEQERAGLDIVTHGDYHHDNSIAGLHWVLYPLERLDGLTIGATNASFPEDMEGEEVGNFPPGRILSEVFHSWRFPEVEGKVQRSKDRPLEFGKIWRLAQARSSKPVMFGAHSLTTTNFWLNIQENSGYHPTDEDHRLLMDLVEASNQELRELAAAGCKVIQVEEPLFHFNTPEDGDTSSIEYMIDAFNKEVEGLGDVEVWVHTCFGNPAMQRDAGGDYAPAVEVFLERLNFDVWTVEAKYDDGKIIDILKPYGDMIKRNNKKIALGAISHRSLQVESPQEVADFTHRALDSIPIENLALTSDCGFGRQGGPRLIAQYKASSLAQGANIVRRDLGYDEHDVPLANPAFQVY